MRDDGTLDDRVKHLEFIQSVIARLATDSFLMKGWALTVSGAFFGVAVEHRSWRLAAVGLLPAIAFWFLDSYFLWQERLFRCLYDTVRCAESSIEPFSMNTAVFKKTQRWLGSFRSVTLVMFYLSLVAVGGCIILGYHNVG